MFLTLMAAPRSMKNPLPLPLILQSNLCKNYSIKEVNSCTFRISLWVLTNAHGCVNSINAGFTTWKRIICVSIRSLLGKELSIVAKKWARLSVCLCKTGSLLALIEMPRWIFVTEEKKRASTHVHSQISNIWMLICLHS